VSISCQTISRIFFFFLRSSSSLPAAYRGTAAIEVGFRRAGRQTSRDASRSYAQISERREVTKTVPLASQPWRRIGWRGYRCRAVSAPTARSCSWSSCEPCERSLSEEIPKDDQTRNRGFDRQQNCHRQERGVHVDGALKVPVECIVENHHALGEPVLPEVYSAEMRRS